MSTRPLCHRLGHYYGHNRHLGTCQRCGAWKEHAQVKPVLAQVQPDRTAWPRQVRSGYVPPSGAMALSLLGKDRTWRT